MEHHYCLSNLFEQLFVTVLELEMFELNKVKLRLSTVKTPNKH